MLEFVYFFFYENIRILVFSSFIFGCMTFFSLNLFYFGGIMGGGTWDHYKVTLAHRRFLFSFLTGY